MSHICNLSECSPAKISTKAAKNFFSMMIITNAEVDKSVSGAGLEYQVSECSWFYRLCLCPVICRRWMDEVRFDQPTLPTEATEVTEDTQRGDSAQTKSGPQLTKA